jgi:serine protease Do
MNMYEHPEVSLKEIKEILNKFSKALQNKIIWGVFLALIILITIGFGIKTYFPKYFDSQVKEIFSGLDFKLQKIEDQKPIIKEELKDYISPISYEQAIIDSVKKASPSVVSIIISKNMPVYEQYFTDPFEGFASPFFDFAPGFDIQIPQYKQKGTEKKEVGGGSGFIVSDDGLVLTNKHVVIDKEAEYTVLTNNGQRYTAKVLALDPVQDLAIVKITSQNGEKFSAIKLGDSAGIQIGQGAIAIGNALGEFRNTVSVGIVSGLSRTILASGTGGFSETLEDIIQTDAAINSGNSGGPLLNLKGEVIGINTAMAQGANSIGFAIPINRAKKDIEQVMATNKITYPFLGVRYSLVNEKIKEKYKLSYDYGALILKGENGEVAITAGSSAEKAGLKENDLILEAGGEKITQENSMAKIIQKYNPNDKITLKVFRDGIEIFIDVVLGERS